MTTTASRQALPTPHPSAHEQSQQLLAVIQHEIAQQGAISFAKYMEMALYEPALGYYVGATNKFGAQGDFITAPEVSPLFGQTLAKFCVENSSTETLQLLELGAGTGKMAADIIAYLNDANIPFHYSILEVSPNLRARQHAQLASRNPDWLKQVSWLDTLPEQYSGIILGNEVVDAMPVTRFLIESGQLFEQRVTTQNEQLVLEKHTPSVELAERISQLDLPIQALDFYQSEINLALPAFISTLNDTLKTGKVILIDYGYNQVEYYHPQRNQGTLMCHYCHHKHDDVFLHPGLQDITAHVNFSDILNQAERLGFHVAYYATQAQFLLQAGLLNLAEQVSNPDCVKSQKMLSQAIQTLTDPAKMGETFKVVVLEK